ncbi:hypothetical protein C8F04DRAFT_1292289 [Mycena alexandri]|uniref:Uncharacterized protein n=1 Tax=Mycena alexandri TaxID=1745969 RepID=A0AAD6SHW8_9AGAR|nr:hypothetical protein C8F04DRAFT_1292289 [Mycena alexandri]
MWTCTNSHPPQLTAPPPPPASSSPGPMPSPSIPSTPPTPTPSQSPSGAPLPRVPLPRRTARNPRPIPPPPAPGPSPHTVPSRVLSFSSSSLVNALKAAQPDPPQGRRLSYYRQPEVSAAPPPSAAAAPTSTPAPVKGPALPSKRMNGRPVNTPTMTPRPYPMHPPPPPPPGGRAVGPSRVMTAPPPFQPVSLPVAIPMPAPMGPPTIPKAEWSVGCATAGCKGSVLSAQKGRRCLACVKASWAGRKERVANVNARTGKVVDEATPKPRVTIKLRLTPKTPRPVAGGQEKAVETVKTPVEKVETPVEKVDSKGKGKAVEEVPETPVVPVVVPVDEGKGKEKETAAVEEEMLPVDAKPTSKVGEDTVENPWDGAGWDSELSDLTDSDEESEPDVQEIPRPSLKIRIPARTPNSSPIKASDTAASALPTPPASASGTPEAPRLCTIARCRIPLPPHSLYRWKCCTACRKQYREYQRDRHRRRLADGEVAAAAAQGSAPATTSNSAEPDSAEAEARRQHAAQKEWQRLENRRALEVAGVPLPPRGVPPKRAPPVASAAPKRVPVDPVATWNMAPGSEPRRKVKTVEGARKCGGRACDHIIPSKEEYAWAICGVCRTRERRAAERAMIREGKTPMNEVLDAKNDLGLAEVYKRGRCMYADCGVLMPPEKADCGVLMPPEKAEVADAECEQCLWRKNQRNKGGRPPGSLNKPKGNPNLPAWNSKAVATAPEKPLEVPRKRKRPSPYPPYQCADDLLKDFGARFAGFVEAQSYYFLLRGGMGPQPPPQAMFDFNGEYSVVATNLDVVTRKSEIELRVHGVKDAVARAGGLEFSPTSWVSILGRPGGLVTRFACVHLVNVLLPVRVPPGHPPNPGRSKSMQGELEIAVLPDDSHKYFAGEKTIVRFRLVG